MTKKHFAAYAAALKSQYEMVMRLKADAVSKQLSHATILRDGQASGLIVAAETFATVAAGQNPRFDRARFLAACGMDGAK